MNEPQPRLSTDAPRRPTVKRLTTGDRLTTILLVLLLTLFPAARSLAQSGYVPHRVYDTAGQRFVDFEWMVASFAGADVLFLGERHGHAPIHQLQLATLEGLARRGQHVALGLEMFDRDVQPPLDAYLESRIAEPEFMEQARPWPHYVMAYRPLVEWARQRDWPVHATNAPRVVVAEVAQMGFAALEELTAAERAHIADELECPTDRYFDRFAEAMREHPKPPDAVDPELALERMYLAQCLRDETMAETIVQILDGAEPPPLVVHVNGGFHSDYRLGVVPRVERRAPTSRMIVLSFVPVDDLDAPAIDPLLADFIVFVLKS